MDHRPKRKKTLPLKLQDSTSASKNVIKPEPLVEKKKIEQKSKSNQKAMSVHEGMKFQCESCYKNFKSKDNLNLHVSKHSKKPHGSQICKFCSKRFSTIDDLLAHMEETHEDTPKYHEPKFVKNKYL